MKSKASWNKKDSPSSISFVASHIYLYNIRVRQRYARGVAGLLGAENRYIDFEIDDVIEMEDRIRFCISKFRPCVEKAGYNSSYRSYCIP